MTVKVAIAFKLMAKRIVGFVRIDCNGEFIGVFAR